MKKIIIAMLIFVLCSITVYSASLETSSSGSQVTVTFNGGSGAFMKMPVPDKWALVSGSGVVQSGILRTSPGANTFTAAQGTYTLTSQYIEGGSSNWNNFPDKQVTVGASIECQNGQYKCPDNVCRSTCDVTTGCPSGQNRCDDGSCAISCGTIDDNDNTSNNTNNQVSDFFNKDLFPLGSFMIKGWMAIVGGVILLVLLLGRR